MKMPCGHETVDEHIRAGWQLAASAQQAISIANLIDALEDNKVEVIGEHGIAQAILQAEGKSAAFKAVDARRNCPPSAPMAQIQG